MGGEEGRTRRDNKREKVQGGQRTQGTHGQGHTMAVWSDCEVAWTHPQKNIGKKEAWQAGHHIPPWTQVIITTRFFFYFFRPQPHPQETTTAANMTTVDKIKEIEAEMARTQKNKVLSI
jgi:hypothetical protein